MFKNISKAKKLKAISAFLVVILVFSVFSVIPASADVKTFSATNPELVGYNLDSNAESDYSLDPFTQQSEYYQPGDTYTTPNGDTRTLAENEYAIKTDATVTWYARDDLGFMYYKTPCGGTKDDKLECTVVLDKDSICGPDGQGISENATMALHLRMGLGESAPHIFFGIRQGKYLHMIYRTKKGAMALEKVFDWNYDFTGKVKIGVRKEGTRIYIGAQYLDGKYKQDEMVWNEIPITIPGNENWYVGVAGYSCGRSGVYMYGEFQDFQVSGQGTLETGDGGDDDPTEVIDPDPAITDDILLQETFSSKDLFPLKPKADNPYWTADLMDTPKFVNLDGNVVYNLTGEPECLYSGNNDWSDYTTSMDFMYVKNECQPNSNSNYNANVLTLHARSLLMPVYGYFGVCVVVKPFTEYEKDEKTGQEILGDDGKPIVKSETTKISLKLEGQIERQSYDNAGGIYGTELASVTLQGDMTQDETWHKLELRTFDNVFTVYFDGEQIMQSTQDTEKLSVDAGKGYPITMGRIGVGIAETSVYIDNITVRKIEDEFGGDYDNMLRGNWNRPIPQYIQEWMSKGLPVY